MNNTQLPLALNASNTSLTFSSNSPLYLDPASNDPISNEYSSCSFKNLGTSLLAISCAKPSTIAVLPTPGSPTNNTLALNFLANTLTMSSSSCVLPIIGSSFCFLAMSVKFSQCSSNISVACLSLSLTSGFLGYVVFQCVLNSLRLMPYFKKK